jgi:hypothetical protein
MKFAKKMTLVPFQEGGGVSNEFKQPDPESVISDENTKKVNSIRKHALDRQTKLLKVVLKLAQTNAYDSNGTATDGKGGRYDVVPLLLYCFSPGRSIRNLDHFVETLHSAGIDPQDILNQNVREMLLQKQEGPPGRHVVTTLPDPVPEADPIQTPAPSMPTLTRAPIIVPATTRPTRVTRKRARGDNASFPPPPPLQGPFPTEETKDKSSDDPPNKVAKSDPVWDADDSDNSQDA